MIPLGVIAAASRPAGGGGAIVTDGLVLHLDPASYSSGQAWANSVASPADGAAQTAYDYILGSTTSEGEDPYWDDVALLLRASDGSLLDIGPSSRAVSLHGSASVAGGAGRWGGPALRIPNVAGSYASVNGSGAVMAGDFTIDLWFKNEGLSSSYWAGIFGTYPGAGWFELQADNINVMWVAGGTALAYGPHGALGGEWVRIGVRREDGVLSIWCDGVQVASVADSRTYTTGTTTRPIIGSGSYSPGSDRAIGVIDDLRVTIGVARDLSVVPTGPVPTASSADSSDPTHAGTYWLFGGDDYFTSAAAATSFIKGMHKAGTQWTIEAWWYRGAAGPDVNPIWDSGTSDQGGSDMSRGVIFGDQGSQINPEGRWGVRIKNDSGGTSALNVYLNAAPALDAWHHHAVSFTGGAGSFLWLDGLVADSNLGSAWDGTPSSPGTLDPANQARIGARGDGAFRVGNGNRLGMLRIYNRALSQAELLQNWNAERATFGA